MRRAGTAGCVINGAAVANSCSAGRALATPSFLAPTSDGQDVYAISASNALLELDRAADGTLTARPDVRGCLLNAAGLAPCTLNLGLGLGAPTTVTVSPDGHYVYATNTGNRINIFKRDSSGPICSDVTVNGHRRVGPAAHASVL